VKIFVIFLFASFLVSSYAQDNTPLVGLAIHQTTLTRPVNCGNNQANFRFVNQAASLQILGPATTVLYNDRFPLIRVRVLLNTQNLQRETAPILDAKPGCEGILPASTVFILESPHTPSDKYSVRAWGNLIYLQLTRACSQGRSEEHITLASGARLKILGLPFRDHPSESQPSLYKLKVVVLEDRQEEPRDNADGCEGFIRFHYLSITDRYNSGTTQARVKSAHNLLNPTECLLHDMAIVAANSKVQVLGEPEAQLYAGTPGIRVRVLLNHDDSSERASEGCVGILKASELNLID
jgi:hypothetical protein